MVVRSGWREADGLPTSSLPVPANAWGLRRNGNASAFRPHRRPGGSRPGCPLDAPLADELVQRLADGRVARGDALPDLDLGERGPGIGERLNDALLGRRALRPDVVRTLRPQPQRRSLALTMSNTVAESANGDARACAAEPEHAERSEAARRPVSMSVVLDDGAITTAKCSRHGKAASSSGSRSSLVERRSPMRSSHAEEMIAGRGGRCNVTSARQRRHYDHQCWSSTRWSRGCRRGRRIG